MSIQYALKYPINALVQSKRLVPDNLTGKIRYQGNSVAFEYLYTESVTFLGFKIFSNSKKVFIDADDIIVFDKVDPVTISCTRG